MERRGTKLPPTKPENYGPNRKPDHDRTLFGAPPGMLKSKQDKPDTAAGWPTVSRTTPRLASLMPRSCTSAITGEPFGQILNATSALRGNLIEDAIEALLRGRQIPYLHAGPHNQAQIAARLKESTVIPAPGLRRV